jgi:hypothetical protein
MPDPVDPLDSAIPVSMKEFAEALRVHLVVPEDGSGLVIYRLAKEAEISPSSLSRYFGGKAVPSWDCVERIVDASARIAQKPRPDTSGLQNLHQRVVHSRIQTNMFQAGREFPYIQDLVSSTQTVNPPASGDQTSNAVVHGDRASEYLRGLEIEIRVVAWAARRRLFAYRGLRFVVLATSATTPALALLRATPLVTASAAAIAFLAEGAIQLTRLNDRAVLDSRRVTCLSREFRMFRTQVGDYAERDSFTRLVRRVEEIREEIDGQHLTVVQESFGSGTSRPEER